MKKYNHNDFIQNYTLTDDEFSLLPNNLKKAYIHKLYDWQIKKVYEKKETMTFKGYIKDIYFDYFNSRGFKVENYDFGTEEHEIKQDGEYIPYEPTKEENEELNKIITSFAEVRASFFELNINDRIDTIKKDFSKGNLDLEQPISFEGLDYYLYEELTSDKFTDIERKIIVSAQINTILLISSSLYSKDYKYYASYLDKCGFEKIEKQRILALCLTDSK